MPSSLLTLKGGRFWMHNAVAEVLLQELLNVMHAQQLQKGATAKVVTAISAALQAGWVDGIVMSDLDDYIADKTLEAPFRSALSEACRQLLADAATRRVVSRGDLCASAEFLRAELAMLDRLLTAPDSMPEPPVIYRQGAGWGTA